MFVLNLIINGLPSKPEDSYKKIIGFSITKF